MHIQPSDGSFDSSLFYQVSKNTLIIHKEKTKEIDVLIMSVFISGKDRAKLCPIF